MAFGQIMGLGLSALGTEINERERNKGQQHYTSGTDPRTRKLSYDFADWITPQIGQKGADYEGDLGYDYSELLGRSGEDVLGRLDDPLKSQYYSAEPLQAMKDVGLRQTEDRYRKGTIDPLKEQMIKYGIRSSYGTDSPVFQAEQDLQRDLGDLGASYDVQIQNMLQQGQAFEEQARADEINRAMQLGSFEQPYLRETQFEIPYQDFMRKEQFPYETVAPLALQYYNQAGSLGLEQSRQINDWNKFMNEWYSAGTPRGNMAQSIGGSMMGSGGGGGGGIMSMFSDKRLKHVLKILNKFSNGLHLVVFEWNKFAKEKFGLDDKKHIGFIAQEVKQVFPDCVKEKDGYLKVDYNLLLSKEMLQEV